VRALSQAHRMLARSGWLAVELGELLAAEATDLTRDRVITDGAPLQLPPRLVQPMALVLHELMSNAVEHGALAHTDGTVTVSWAEQPAGIFLEWREHGAQTAGPPDKQGFGLKMLMGLIERQLGGRVATSWAAQGFRAEMTMPVPEKGRPCVEG
jgi:two-component sensor histidine kinase